MFFTVIGYALGFVFVGFVAAAAYKLWTYIPTKTSREKKQQQAEGEN